MTHEEMLAVREQAERELKQRFSGVEGVGLGYRVRAGQITDEVTLRVYVTQKQPLSALAPDQVLPREYGGIAIDVHTLVEPLKIAADPDPCSDRAQYDPLLGGISISNCRPTPANEVPLGTLGFFVTLTGETAPRNIALVTCAHVVTDAGSGLNDTFYQPGWTLGPDGYPLPLLDRFDRRQPALTIGPVVRLPAQTNDSNDFFVDAAAIKLDFCISSCCHTNCGLSFSQTEIRGLGVAGSDHIVDIAPANSVQMGDTVVKVGRRTGRTVGRVNAVMIPSGAAHHVIEIAPVSMQGTGNCGGTLRFAAEGDSGSALIDAHGKLIGLLFGIDPATQTLGYACYIDPVLTALNAVAITRAHPVAGNPAATAALAELPAVPAMIDGKPNRTPELRARVLASARGRELWALVDQHRLEALQLVNHNRRVMVAWHRHQGPAFLNRLMANARDPDTTIPREIAGVTRRALLEAMASAFLEHGSAALRAAVERHLAEARTLIDAGDDLHVLVGLLDPGRAA